VTAFCGREGIAVSSFYAWKRKLGGARGGFVEARVVHAAPAFVEAKVADVPAGTRPPGVIEVRLRGGRRRVLVRREGFDRALLLEVVAALESLPRGTEAES